MHEISQPQTNAVSTPQFPVDFMPYLLKEAQKWGEKTGLTLYEVNTIHDFRTKYNNAATIEEKMDTIVSV